MESTYEREQEMRRQAMESDIRFDKERTACEAQLEKDLAEFEASAAAYEARFLVA